MIEVASDVNGRLVIPQRVRRALGIHGPAQWWMEVQGAAAVLKPKHQAQGRWRRKGKTWVLIGVPEVDPVLAVESLREEQ